MELRELLAGADVVEVKGDPLTEITDLAYDSRQATPGTLFFCIPGFTADGHDFARYAVQAGATAVVVERPLELDVYADAGTITALLTQTTKNKTRPDMFFSVERDLITGFRGKFGSAAEIDISHEKAEP